MTYSMNPLATTFNSKMYMRFMAAKIPNNLIASDATHVKVEIDMTT